MLNFHGTGRGEVAAMQSVLRAAASSRIGLVGLLLAVSLSGCDTVSDWFGKSKTPLAGERVPVFSERSELEPDKEMASVQVVLPAPSVNDSWPQSGGFANYAMHNLAVSNSPQIIWTADVGAGSTLLAHPDDAAGRGRGQGLRQGRAEHGLGLQRRHRPARSGASR